MIRSSIMYIQLLFYFALTVLKCLINLKSNLEKQDEIIYRWSKKMLSLVHAQLTLPQNIDWIPGRRYIIMSNHCSLFDIPVIFQTFPKSTIRMIAKSELKKYPLLGFVMRHFHFVFINRSSRSQAIKELNVAKKLMQEKDIKIWMAPEGTRSLDPTQLQVLKKGGFILSIDVEAIIIPVWIAGTSNIIAAKSLRFAKGQNVEVKIGEPIDTRLYKLDQKDILIEEFRKRMHALSLDKK